MALSSERRKQLLELRSLNSERTQKRLARYLSRAGIHPNDFGRRINYAGVTVRFFLSGQYHSTSGNDRAFCAAAEEFMDAHPLAPETESPGTLYETPDVRMLRGYFYNALDRGWAYYIYSPPGTRKTFLAKALIAELNQREISKNGNGRRAYRVYCPAAIRPTDLLKRVAAATATPPAASADRIVANLRFEFRHRRMLLVFDEAQNLERICLERIRELLDEPPHCGMLFLGSHDLVLPFKQMDLAQWKRRMHGGGILPGFTEEDAKRVLLAELGPDCSKRQIARMIDDCRETDIRQGQGFTYISAGDLFFGIEEVKSLRDAKAAGKEGRRQRKYTVDESR